VTLPRVRNPPSVPPERSALSTLTNLTAQERRYLAPLVSADPELRDAIRAAAALGGARAAMAVLRARGLLASPRLGAPDPEAARVARRRRKARRRWAEEVERQMRRHRER
jgi:hypothetical protein